MINWCVKFVKHCKNSKEVISVEIHGKALEILIQEIKDKTALLKQEIQTWVHLLGDIWYIYIVPPSVQLRSYEDDLMKLELLQLTEEKRRLLTRIIERAMVVNSQCGARYYLTVNAMNDVEALFEFNKRINQADTMEELALIDKEIADFRRGKR